MTVSADGLLPADLINRQIRLAARPFGLPKPTDWEVVL